MKLVLGSSSKFRKAQLEQLRVPFDTYSPDIDEDQIKNSSKTPLEISRELSLEKAKAVLEKYPNDLVIGADQVLNFKGEIFSKPGTAENAMAQLKKLRNETHELITSYALITKDKEIVETVISKMTMRDLTDEQIRKYVELDEPLYSCGAYKLETLGISLFKSIECPDHSAIIGLPLISLTTQLEKFDVKVL
ncbi:nucleoside triphosphate pyrophosphatase [Bacteriovorax sp. DB6_IX]|uniref:Maf family protein n=1 Tax=Bacteriovorax sp. DB6_IX TaxID=1353530 RepID=UPI000389FBC2|nr:nucleoside triphosphate pyrophosphatase [Bacteriovorax sp. DB6_IX]EQC50482.1 septum formation protein Maf [Bacteriovorax sp. DB6_IX]